MWFLWPLQILFLTKSPFATLILAVLYIYLSAKASDYRADDAMHVQRLVTEIFDC